MEYRGYKITDEHKGSKMARLVSVRYTANNGNSFFAAATIKQLKKQIDVVVDNEDFIANARNMALKLLVDGNRNN